LSNTDAEKYTVCDVTDVVNSEENDPEWKYVMQQLAEWKSDEKSFWRNYYLSQRNNTISSVTEPQSPAINDSSTTEGSFTSKVDSLPQSPSKQIQSPRAVSEDFDTKSRSEIKDIEEIISDDLTKYMKMERRTSCITTTAAISEFPLDKQEIMRLNAVRRKVEFRKSLSLFEGLTGAGYGAYAELKGNAKSSRSNITRDIKNIVYM